MFTLRSWWHHQMDTFSALLDICAGNSPVTGEFLAQRPVTRSFEVFFHLRLNKRLRKQSWGWWFETPSCPLWRHTYVVKIPDYTLRTSKMYISRGSHHPKKLTEIFTFCLRFEGFGFINVSCLFRQLNGDFTNWRTKRSTFVGTETCGMGNVFLPDDL